jgi:hypothetical protein
MARNLARRLAEMTAAAKPPLPGFMPSARVVLVAWCRGLPLTADVFVIDGTEHAVRGMPTLAVVSSIQAATA